MDKPQEENARTEKEIENDGTSENIANTIADEGAGE